MTGTLLSLREINRATLARQMLLERVADPLSVTAGIEQLAGMQAQAAMSPFVGLWSRLHGFQREHLTHAIENRTVIKATWVRATLHLVTAADYWRFRATLQPVLTAAWNSISDRRSAPVDLDAVLTVARAFIAEAPRTFAEISAMLSARFPDQDVSAMRYGVRTHLPMVQVPIPNSWSYPGNPSFTLAETWLGSLPAPEIETTAWPQPVAEARLALLRRYLSAFGPATYADMQTWSGLSRLKAEFEALRPDLVCFHDEKRRELFDLPDAPRPPEDLPAPVRFLPEYDNLLLSHTDRTRVVANEYRKAVYLPALRVAATILVDGFVSGAWKVEKRKGAVTLVIEPFIKLTPAQRAAVEEEGLALVQFIEPQAKAHTIEWK